MHAALSGPRPARFGCCNSPTELVARRPKRRPGCFPHRCQAWRALRPGRYSRAARSRRRPASAPAAVPGTTAIDNTEPGCLRISASGSWPVATSHWPTVRSALAVSTRLAIGGEFGGGDFARSACRACSAISAVAVFQSLQCPLTSPVKNVSIVRCEGHGRDFAVQDRRRPQQLCRRRRSKSGLSFRRCAVSTSRPSCDIVATDPWPIPSSRSVCVPVATSQMRAVLSAAAVSRRLPSGEKAAVDTRYSWPSSKSLKHLAGRRVPDLCGAVAAGGDDPPAVAGECGGKHGVGVSLQHAALQHADLFIARDVPQLDRLVVAAGEDNGPSG